MTDTDTQLEEELVLPRRRWYDQEPHCAKMLLEIKNIDREELQSFCGRIIRHVAEQIRKRIQLQNDKGITSIGVPGISALYSFRQKQRRWYDDIPDVQKAVGTLYTLPHEGLSALSFGLNDALGLISIYCQVCDELGNVPSVFDLVEISKRALNQGPNEAKSFMKQLIGDDLYQAFVATKFGEPDKEPSSESDDNEEDFSWGSY